MTRCPCLSGLQYAECCEPIHAGSPSPTAERLMRSRYSAYALGLPDYLVASWHPSTRPENLELDARLNWYRLDIVSRTRGAMLDTIGTVEFDAHYRLDGERGHQHENSRFVKESGHWYYVDGDSVS